VEVGVVHRERREDARANELVERQPRREADEVADDVGRDAVVPRGTRRELERHAGQPLDQRLEALRLEGVEA
jgi:hypothetical protein